MSYRILDEPQPGPMAQLAVQPFWPLLAVMFGGAWLSWPWFAVNGYAIGSPTRKRELTLAVAGFAGTFFLLVFLTGILDSGLLPEVAGRYLPVALSVWKLGVSYWLFAMQSRTFDLYQHFGGPVRNGILVVLAATFLGPALLGGLPGILQVILR